MFGAESAGSPDGRRIYYNYPTSGDGAGSGCLDKSGDVSGLASGGTYEKIPEIGVLSPGNPRPRNPCPRKSPKYEKNYLEHVAHSAKYERKAQ
jgi:hypothetical protein